MGAILDALAELEHTKGFLADDDLDALAARLGEARARLDELVAAYPTFRRAPPARVEVALCRDAVCRLMGGPSWCEHARAALEGREGVAVREVACLGRCDGAPAATVNGAPVVVSRSADLVAAVDAPAGAPAARKAARRFACDPYASVEHRYDIVGKIVRERMSTDLVLGFVRESGLAGRGGSGFPAAQKWEIARAAPGSPKYVIANAHESEPGTFKDRVLLDEAPHLVLEGLAIAAYVVGASEGIVFVRHEYLAERESLTRALDDARARRVIGPDARGPGRPFEVRVVTSAGGYLLGEETALLEHLEDRPGKPRSRPPFPVEQGLFGRPTLVHNVETLALLATILDRGPAGWKARGRRGARGLKIVAVSGDVARPGVYEVPMGTTFAELVEGAGGVRGGRALRAFAPGGASSGFLPADAADTPIDFDAVRERGSSLGSAGVIVVGEGADLVDLAASLVAFFRDESCGKCSTCRIGTQRAAAALADGASGRGTLAALQRLPALGDAMAKASICGLGRTALAPILSLAARPAFEAELAARFPSE